MTRDEHPLHRIWKSFGDEDVAYWDNRNRERVDDDHEEWLIEGLIPIGATVLYAAPDAGKSFLVQSVIHHLIYGRPLGPWGTESDPRALCWVIDFEGTWRMNQDRGYTLTPYGRLPLDGTPDRGDFWCFWSSDLIPPDERPDYRESYRRRSDAHLAFLDRTLTEAEEAGAPIRLVVIDTLLKFAGARPKNGGNAYEWEAQLVDGLNRIGQRHAAAVVIVHHTNKAGEISGSTGLAGSAVVMMRLDVDEEDEQQVRAAGVQRTGVLRSVKCRIGPPFVYALQQSEDGAWDFVDQAPSVTAARGHARIVLADLAEHPEGLTARELLSSTGLGESLRTTLTRLRAGRQVHNRHGRWYLAQLDIRSVPGAAQDPRCLGCGGTLTFGSVHPNDVCEARARGTDPTSEQSGPPAATSEQSGPPAATSEHPPPGNSIDPVDIPEEEAPAPAPRAPSSRPLAVLKGCVEKSRMKPVMFIRAEHRTALPWPLIEEAADGKHSWVRAELPAGGYVTNVDRNGSFPSAMSSVIVVANLMHHTGPLPDGRPSLRTDGAPVAGIFQIEIPRWGHTKIGHPLGRTADIGPTAWVTTPHVQLLEQLAAAGELPPPVILDSWTGRGTGGLFSGFSKYVKSERERLIGGDPAAYIEMKRGTSSAIRCLWPTDARSPFWRPDWNISVRAEASVRHWIRAWQALNGGAELLALRMYDETSFAGTELPAPYQFGTGFGQVKPKKVTVAGEEWTSPMPIEIWRQSIPTRKLRKRR